MKFNPADFTNLQKGVFRTNLETSLTRLQKTGKFKRKGKKSQVIRGNYIFMLINVKTRHQYLAGNTGKLPQEDEVALLLKRGARRPIGSSSLLFLGQGVLTT